ncbi:unnamed protein product [Prunus armeniaca]|uniref:RNase H type-1 domain-containing protein n=1 Tax=Prunus armeniaca TaxID=36596 RepID=A0A6J5UPH1_PRUAR|nr:unnamed protein product [Prunus armeniaca]
MYKTQIYDAEFKAEIDSRHRRPSLPSQNVCWQPMWVGSFKLNVDVAVDVKDGCRGVGILVCDSNSNLLRAVAIVAPGMVSVLATELYVMKVGMSYAIDASCVPLVHESDCMNDVQLVQK